MPETFRAFIAVDLPDSIRSSLGEAQEMLKLHQFRAKWVRPQNIHLTLKFLGNTDVAQIDNIVAVMAQATKDCTAVSLTAKGIGVFPDIRRPRVIWAGLKGKLEILQEIQQTLDLCLADLGFPKETRAFNAHLTLGRVKGKINPARMKAAIVELEGFESRPFDVNRIILFKSDLRPGGAVYTRVQEVSF